MPLRPMVGCIGVAPADGYDGTMAPVVRTGGNLDIPDIEEGATVYLPVQVPGAWLSLGDLHAVMARGESTFVALEMAGAVTVSIQVLRGRSIHAPLLESPDELMTVGLGDAVHTSVRAAMLPLFRLLTEEGGLTDMDAFALLSAAGHTELGGPVGSGHPDPDHGTPVGVVTVGRLSKALLPSPLGWARGTLVVGR